MKEFVVVTRGIMQPSGKVIVHAYGPYTRSEATALRRKMLQDMPNGSEASVCRMLA